MNKSLLLCMFMFIVLLGLMNWLSHDKIQKDHVENFEMSAMSTDNDSSLENRKPNSKRLQGSPYVSMARSDGPALALLSQPFEADVDYNDVLRERDEGIDALREKEYKWKVLLTKVLDALERLEKSFNVLTRANNYLKTYIEKLKTELEALNERITNFKNDEKSSERGISPEHYFNLDKVIEAKQQIDRTIEELRTHISGHLESKVTTKSNIKSTTVNGIINHVKQLQQRINELMTSLVSVDEMLLYCRNSEGKQLPSELLSICNSINLEGELGVSSIQPLTDKNIDKARNICESKKGTCYVNNTDPTNPATFVSKDTPFVFYQDRWPEDVPTSCVEDRVGCLGDDELGCDKDTCFYLNDQNNHQYYGNEVSNELMEDATGNLTCQKPDSCISENDRMEEARTNCQGPNNGSARYPCWTTTGSPINSVASAMDPESWSKTWLPTQFGEMTGECSVNDTCRTEGDTQKEVACLAEMPDTQNKDDEYKGNYQCFNNNGSGTESYRKSFVQGRWDDEKKTWVSTEPHCKTNGSGEAPCRTKQDVEAQLRCESKEVVDGNSAANWDCYKLNVEGPVNTGNYMSLESVEDPGKTRNVYIPHENKYATSGVNPINMGVGTCETSTCRPEADVDAEVACYQSDENHLCWSLYNENKPHEVYTEPGTNDEGYTMRHVYNRPNEHNGQGYSQYCGTNDPCMNSTDAIPKATEICHGVENPFCYRIPDEQKQNHDRRDIVLAENGDGYEDGRRTKLHITYSKTNPAKPIKGECMNRQCDFDKPGLCRNQQIQCYFKRDGDDQDTSPTPTNMIYNNDENDPACVHPEGCSKKPFCSYRTITNGSPNYPFSGEETYCPPGSAKGSRYKWRMECMNNENGEEVCKPFDDSDLNCIKTPQSFTNPTLDGSEYDCSCPTIDDKTNNPEYYSAHYQHRYFSSESYQDNDNKGYTLEEAHNLCPDDKCDKITVHGVDTNISGCKGATHIESTKTTEIIYCDKGCAEACRRKNETEYCFVKSTNDMSVSRYAYSQYSIDDNENARQLNVESVNVNTPKNSIELNGKGCVDYASPNTDYDEDIYRCKETPYPCQYGEPEWTYTGSNSDNNVAFLDENWNSLATLQAVSDNEQLCGNEYSRSRTVTNQPYGHSILDDNNTITCAGYNESENTKSKTARGCVGDCDYSYNLEQCSLELDANANGDGDQYEFVYKPDGYAPYNYISGPENGGEACPIDDNTGESRTTGTKYIHEECCKRGAYEYVYYSGNTQNEFTNKITVSQEVIDNWNDNTYKCDSGTKFVNRRLEKKPDATCHGEDHYNPSSKECAIPLEM